MASIAQLEPPQASRIAGASPTARLQREVLELKRKRNAVILAHNYQVPEIQDVADYVGDSLGLSQQAAKTDADVIAFCGVHFMAETAKILNPKKQVVLPDKEAGCSLVDACPPYQLKAYLDKNPGLYVISYINCSAAVKALSDCICTSGNATKIVAAAPTDREILFCPDQHLGEWVSQKTGRKMRLWPGACYAHVQFTHDSILRIKRKYPDAPVVAHPECMAAVRMLADEVCSTEKMVTYCKTSPAHTIIIATESGIIHRLQKECPDKKFIPAPTDSCACNECKFMKMNTLGKLRDCLADLQPEITLDEDVRQRAYKAVARMLELSK